MGDHCATCAYNPKERLGDKACPFNALYWDFFDRHQGQLAQQPRLGMVYQQLKKMPEEALSALREKAAQTRRNAAQC
jgi:deoxyribodipyrimidine photolyase-related protein